MESLRGKLLISSPVLVDPNFRRTIVLISHHDEDGAMGLVLNRPTELKVGQMVPELSELPVADELIYLGGPVQSEAFVGLAEFSPDTDAVTVIGRVGLVPADSMLSDLPIERLRIFAGYAGWGAGQLEGEIDDESWIIVDAHPDDAFATDGDVLWRTIAHRKGGRYALIATMPFDPRLN